MSKMKYKTTKKYIGIETGFIQAATLLDMAAVDAIACKDYARVTEVAKTWIDLSLAMKKAIASEDESEDVDDENTGSTHEHGPVGFGVTVKEMKEHNDKLNRSAP